MTKRSFFKLLFGPYLAAASFPLLVFANEQFGVGLWPWFVLCCLSCTVQILFGILFGAKRLLPGMIATGLFTFAFAALQSGRLGLGHAIVIACLIANPLYALFLSTHTWEDIASPKYMTPVLILNLLIAFGMAFSMMHDQVLLGWVAMPYLIAALFLSNRRTIKSSASMQSGLNLRIIHQNLLIMIAFIAVLLLAINFHTLASWVEQLLIWAVVLILKLMALFGGGEDGAGGMGAGGGTPDLSGLGEAKSAPFWDILSVIVQYLVLIALIAGAIVGLYFGIKRLSRFLSGTLRKFVGAYQDGFIDESQTLKTAQQMREEIVNTVSDRIKKLLTPAPNWEKLSPAERIRYAYRKTRQRARAVGIDPDPLTPHELLASKRLTLDGERKLFEETYYQTRYHGALPDEAQQANAKSVAQTRK